MKITALLENTTKRPDMQVEHGLSLLIETARHTLLFDMGQTGLFAANARTLGIDLTRVDLAVLSHGHYDHGGGLATFLDINRQAPVYLHKDAFLPHYNGTEKYIGLDPALSRHPRLVFTEDFHSIAPHLTLTTGVLPPPAPSGLTEKVGDAFVPEDFRHEQYLLIEEEGKRVLVSGCSHKGILAIAAQFSPDYLIGGFHFSHRPLDASLTADAVALAAHPTTYYTCHCTGTEHYRFMKESMPGLHYLACGETVHIG